MAAPLDRAAGQAPVEVWRLSSSCKVRLDVLDYHRARQHHASPLSPATLAVAHRHHLDVDERNEVEQSSRSSSWLTETDQAVHAVRQHRARELDTSGARLGRLHAPRSRLAAASEVRPTASPSFRCTLRTRPARVAAQASRSLLSARAPLRHALSATPTDRSRPWPHDLAYARRRADLKSLGEHDDAPARTTSVG